MQEAELRVAMRITVTTFRDNYIIRQKYKKNKGTNIFDFAKIFVPFSTPKACLIRLFFDVIKKATMEVFKTFNCVKKFFGLFKL